MKPSSLVAIMFLFLGSSCSEFSRPRNVNQTEDIDRILSDILSDTTSADSIPYSISQLVSDFERTLVLYYKDDYHILDDMYKNMVDYSLETNQQFIRLFNVYDRKIESVTINDRKFKITYLKDKLQLVDDSNAEVLIEYADNKITKYHEKFNNSLIERSLDGSIINEVKNNTIDRSVDIRYDDNGLVLEKIYSNPDKINVVDLEVDLTTRRQYKYYASKDDLNKYYVHISESSDIIGPQKFLVINNSKLEIVLHCSSSNGELMVNRYSLASYSDSTLRSYETFTGPNNTIQILPGAFLYTYNSEGNLSLIQRTFNNKTTDGYTFKYYQSDGHLYKYEMYNNGNTAASLIMEITE